MTIEECEHGRRLVAATFFGSFIGWERRNADRPAGIRTMALVSLGACLFTLCSTFAFVTGPMNWDASRVSAAIPSGVGFLGSALIFKHTTSEEKGGAWHEVHGLTTAASVWLSAAVGIACAGGLFFISALTTSILLVMLRFGPRSSATMDEEDEEEDDLDDDNTFAHDRFSGKDIEMPVEIGDGQNRMSTSEMANLMRSNRASSYNTLMSRVPGVPEDEENNPPAEEYQGMIPPMTPRRDSIRQGGLSSRGMSSRHMSTSRRHRPSLM